MANEDGVWRTVGGRRIFIKDGEDLSSAMKSSGKFKNKKEKEQNQQEDKNSKENKYTDKQLEMVWENEDATEVYDHLSQSEKNKMSQAQKDIEILTPGTPGYQNAKEYVDKMNDKAASKFLEAHKNDKDYEGYYMSDKYVASENKKLDISDQKYNIEKTSGLKVEKAYQTDAFGTGKEDRFKLEDGRYVAHSLEDDTWSVNKVSGGKIESKDYKSYDDMLKNLKGGSESNAYKKAFEDYKKKHPSSKITLNKFIDMSEGK